MCNYLNVGSGEDLSIKELAEIIKKVVDYKGQINFDSTKLDGSPRKFIDSKALNSLGWWPEVSLKVGLAKTYKEFLKN